MLNMTVMPLGAYQTNCYILWEDDSDSCIVVDPGYQPEVVLAQTEKMGRKIAAILLTHGHFDHVGAVETICDATGCKLWMAQADYTQPKSQESDFFYPIHDCDFTEVNFCEEGQTIQAGGLTFAVLETPGHTWGSVCYVCQDHIFSGDTLFQGSCGRTDLPGGDWATILRSLKRLATMDGNYHVHPGHGPSTTLAEERIYNPYMQ